MCGEGSRLGCRSARLAPNGNACGVPSGESNSSAQVSRDGASHCTEAGAIPFLLRRSV
jgi:hypothetical protein